MLSTTFLQLLAKNWQVNLKALIIQPHLLASTFHVQSHENPSFSFSNVTVSQVLKQLKKLDVNKATGLDNINAHLLKAKQALCLYQRH